METNNEFARIYVSLSILEDILITDGTGREEIQILFRQIRALVGALYKKTINKID